MTDVTPREGFFGKSWKHKWLILATTALGAGSASVAARRIPSTYRSQALVVVVPQRVPIDYVKPTVNTSLEERLQAITTTVFSRTRLEQTIEQFNLYADERRKGIMEEVVQHMRDDIRVEMKSNDAFMISYDGGSPYTVQRVAESLTSSFIQESFQDHELLAQSTYQFMESTAEELRRRLVEYENRLAESAARNGGRQPSQIAVIEYQALHESYRSVMLKLEQSRIASNLEHRQIGEQFKLLDPARVPEQPISPDRTRLNTIGALAGFAVGVLFVSSRRRS